jgi:polysaccharide chain length determinant protein (PEP-CTERM system associated)
MQNQVTQLLYYVKATFRHKWLALFIAWAICLGSWVYIYSMPNKFISEAKVHVETKTMLQPLLKGMTVPTDSASLLRVMRLLMFTRNNLEQIIKMSDFGKKNAAGRADLVEKLKKDIKIEGGYDDVFTIKYEGTSAALAKNVVQAVLTVFSEQTHQSTLAGANVAKKFIDEQIQEFENRLRNAEKARENFKRANIGLLPGEGGDQIAQAQAASVQLEEAQLALNGVISRRNALLAQLNEIKDSKENWEVTDKIDKPSDKDAMLEALLNRKKELLLRYTESHPAVISVNKMIDAEKEKLITEKATAPEPKNTIVTPKVLANPYIQTIKVALNETEAEVAGQQGRIEQLKARVNRMKEELNARLTVETELQNINRDYDAIKTNYQKLIESREQANMSEKVDDQAEALKFKIADAPNVPLKPSSPVRVYLYSAALAAGLAVGFGLSLLLYLLRPTVISTTQLGQLTGLPIIGAVSMKKNDNDITRHRKAIALYSVGFLGLMCIYMAFMTAELLEVNFSGLLRKII